MANPIKQISIKSDGGFHVTGNRPPYLAYVLTNYERLGLSRPTQLNKPLGSALGLPDTCKLQDSTYVELTEELQWYWFDLLKQNAPSYFTDDDLKLAWRKLTRDDQAFTNFAGSDTRADYINGTNLDKEPMGYEPIITGGNVVWLTDLNLRDIKGELYYKLYCIDSTKPLPSINEVNNALTCWLVFSATTSKRLVDLNTKTILREDLEEPFWWLDGNNVPVPLLGNSGTNYIPKNRVRILGNDEEIPSPYHF